MNQDHAVLQGQTNTNLWEGISPWGIKGLMAHSVLLFLIGSVLHFAFAMCGKFTLVGLFAPVNESIFEHAKLAFVPLAGWWMATYLLNRQKYAQVKNNFFAAGMASALSGTLIMPMLYYFYHAGLNIESLAVDILLLFVCIVAGQLAGRHVLFHGKNKFPAWASIAILVTFFVVCALCTLFAPHLSFFKESFSGKYGI